MKQTKITTSKHTGRKTSRTPQERKNVAKLRKPEIIVFSPYKHGSGKSWPTLRERKSWSTFPPYSKPLPTIIILGVGKTPAEKQQSLIEIEAVLVYYYNVDDEKYNNRGTSDSYRPSTAMKCYEKHDYTTPAITYYIDGLSLAPAKTFFASQLSKILFYIENYSMSK